MFETKMIEFLACPVCKGWPLRLLADKQDEVITEGKLVCPGCNREYYIIEGVPILLPDLFERRKLQGVLVLNEMYDGPDREVWSKWQQKQKSCCDLYSQPLSEEYQFWAKCLTESFAEFCFIKDSVLDIGCGDPSQSIKYISGSNYYYIGLDPFVLDKRTPFPLVQGIGEWSPFRDECLDNVTLITTLDHSILPHRVLKEACRVLKPNGKLFIMNLIWESHFSPEKDAFHFFHFSKQELLNLLPEELVVRETQSIDYKESYRRVLFLQTEKVRESKE